MFSSGALLVQPLSSATPSDECHLASVMDCNLIPHLFHPFFLAISISRKSPLTPAPVISVRGPGTQSQGGAETEGPAAWDEGGLGPSPERCERQHQDHGRPWDTGLRAGGRGRRDV